MNQDMNDLIGNSISKLELVHICLELILVFITINTFIISV